MASGSALALRMQEVRLWDVVRVLDALPREVRVSAPAFQDAAEQALRAAGYRVEREAPVEGGFLDLRLNDWFGVELDRRSCRRNSVRKMAQCEGGLIYSRDPL